MSLVSDLLNTDLLLLEYKCQRHTREVEGFPDLVLQVALICFPYPFGLVAKEREHGWGFTNLGDVLDANQLSSVAGRTVPLDGLLHDFVELRGRNPFSAVLRYL